MLEDQIREAFPELDDEEVQFYLERDFAGWMREKVAKKSRHSWPLWVHEFVLGPIASIKTSKMYCTRGFIFHTFQHGQNKATANYGIHVPGDTNFYGILKEIIEIEYAGVLNLKTVLFRCDWFDPSIGVGVRTSKFGVVDVKGNRSYTDKFEPFILASQAEQVVFIPYPRTRAQRDQDWLSVIKVNPRGRIVGGLAADADDDQPPVQPARTEEVSIPTEVTTDLTRIDPLHSGLDVIFEDSEGNGDEFDEDDDAQDEENDDEDEEEAVGVERYLFDHDDQD